MLVVKSTTAIGTSDCAFATVGWIVNKTKLTNTDMVEISVVRYLGKDVACCVMMLFNFRYSPFTRICLRKPIENGGLTVVIIFDQLLLSVLLNQKNHPV